MEGVAISGEATAALVATITDRGDLLVPAAAIDAAPGDLVQVRIVRPSGKRTNA